MLQFVVGILFVFSIQLHANENTWADERVNLHLQNTGMNIYMQEQSTELERSRLLLEQSLEEADVNSPKNNSYGIIFDEETTHNKDFEDSAFQAPKLRSPSNQLQLDVQEKRERAYYHALQREAYLKGLLKNIKDSGIRMNEVK